MAHFLKRLELNGFKSFAGKTTLEFPAGITAIVGPNGSGKSNVVDAIRWLLGERDAKNLRGAKVEDLIFAGTAKRPRVGQAQASLHFENANNFFPVEFAEVSVMREIRRDGTSRYFLNKSEILLRDLIDFFAKARLGSRGLIVVTQGNSDIFIQADPKSRREMIEEILGLREYQIKKGDAERRLKNSQINLDKVKALIEEILPHLRSLKRQTSRWERRGAMEDELRGLEDQFFGSQISEIKAGLGVIEKKISAEKQELTELEREKKIALEAQAEVEANQPEERREMQKIKEEIQSLIGKRGDLHKELGRLEAQIEMASRQGASLKPESVSRLSALVKKIKDELRASLDGDMVEMRETIKSVIEEIDELLGDENSPLRPGSEASQSKRESGLAPELKSQFAKINQDLKSLENEMLALKEKEKNLEKNQEEFYRSFKAAVAAVDAAKGKIEKWSARNRENLFEKERLDLRHDELARQINQAGRDPREFTGSTAVAIAEAADLAQAEKRIFKLRGDLASIGEIDEALMKEATETEARYQFLSKESEDLEKAVRSLKELIKDLSEKIKVEFGAALIEINQEFGKFFDLMFDGGHAKLRIEKRELRREEKEGEAGSGDAEEEIKDKNKVVEEIPEEGGGVEIELRLPRKKINSLEMLSGGERSLVGIAALFALISVSPPPFLVLDEIDAALDERNARRFAEMLREFSKKTQFVVVTHNRATMEAANVLYGVTLSEDGTSKILSLKL